MVFIRHKCTCLKCFPLAFTHCSNRMWLSITGRVTHTNACLLLNLQKCHTSDGSPSISLHQDTAGFLPPPAVLSLYFRLQGLYFYYYCFLHRLSVTVDFNLHSPDIYSPVYTEEKWVYRSDVFSSFSSHWCGFHPSKTKG